MVDSRFGVEALDFCTNEIREAVTMGFAVGQDRHLFDDSKVSRVDSSCNGLLLFGHRRDSDSYDSLGYIVCNPATEQWVTVPSSGWKPFL